ncbi:MAG: hypothetical protein HXY34_03650 [Candidatus Thorarchaeota archaeon]|nr:hypothetical protein [Candidatus Thorarchaeota archaeon]
MSQQGETLASVGMDRLGMDTSAFGGFVSAVQMFAKKIASNELSEVKMGKMKMIVSRAKDNYVVTLHSDDDEMAARENSTIAQILSSEEGVAFDQVLVDRVSQIVPSDHSLPEEMRESLLDWSRKELEHAKRAASDWAKSVF